MPIYAPRAMPVKKEEELLKRDKELRFAIKSNHSEEKLIVAIEKYRKAQLSLLKAKAHVIKVEILKHQEGNKKIDAIESQIETWKNKTQQEILSEFQ